MPFVAAAGASIIGGMLASSGAKKQAKAQEKALKMEENARQEAKQALTTPNIFKSAAWMFPGLLPFSMDLFSPKQQAHMTPGQKEMWGQIAGMQPGQPGLAPGVTMNPAEAASPQAGPAAPLPTMPAGGGMPPPSTKQAPVSPPSSGKVQNPNPALTAQLGQPSGPQLASGQTAPVANPAEIASATTRPGIATLPQVKGDYLGTSATAPSPSPAAPTLRPTPKPGIPTGEMTGATMPGGVMPPPNELRQGQQQQAAGLAGYPQGQTYPGGLAVQDMMGLLQSPGQFTPALYERQQEQASQALNTAMTGIQSELAGRGIDPSSGLGQMLSQNAMMNFGKQRMDAARDYSLAQEELRRQDIQQGIQDYMSFLSSVFGLTGQRSQAASGKGFSPIQNPVNPNAPLASGIGMLGNTLTDWLQSRQTQTTSPVGGTSIYPSGGGAAQP